MASKKEIDYSYSTIDKIWRLSIGEMADFTGAKYDGDFTMSLEAAQLKKHQWISDQLNVTNGQKILDIGCGWGPLLNHFRNIGATGIGITLSQGQYAACQKNGLEAHVKDYRVLTPEDFGEFDAIASVGAFEHFCSVEDYKQGRQDEVYKDFFKKVNDLLPTGGRCFIQTMVFDKGMIQLKHIDPKAPKQSNEYLMALIVNEFPGSWLPYGPEHLIESAKPYFKLITHHSGKDDYIETIKVWRKRLKSFGLRKYLEYAKLVPKLLYDVKMRRRYQNLKIAPIKVAFERGIWDHYRLIFEKV